MQKHDSFEMIFKIEENLRYRTIRASVNGKEIGRLFYSYPEAFSRIYLDVVYLSNLWVDPAWRHKGIATKLNKYLFERLENYKKECVYFAKTKNQFVIHMLEKMGFKIIQGTDNTYLIKETM